MFKKIALASALVGLTYSVNAAQPGAPLETDQEKVSYSFGMIFGQRMQGDLPDVDLETFIQGIRDGYSGGPALLTEQQRAEAMQKFQQQQRDKHMQEFEGMAAENKAKGEQFLAGNKNKEGVVTLASGLQYKILKEGNGPKPGAMDTVKVHYEGSLIDGTVFDSSIARGEPVSFPLSSVIKGWTEGLQLMPTGSKWQLFIPSDLAYGPGGNRGIGPNETLLFVVELLDVQTKIK